MDNGRRDACFREENSLLLDSCPYGSQGCNRKRNYYSDHVNTYGIIQGECCCDLLDWSRMLFVNSEGILRRRDDTPWYAVPYLDEK